MRHIQFKSTHTVHTIPPTHTKCSLTETNRRAPVPLFGACFEETAKTHCGGRSHGALPAGWVERWHEGSRFYHNPLTATSTWQHPRAVEGETWSEALRVKRRGTRARRVAAAVKIFAARAQASSGEGAELA